MSSALNWFEIALQAEVDDTRSKPWLQTQGAEDFEQSKSPSKPDLETDPEPDPKSDPKPDPKPDPAPDPKPDGGPPDPTF